MSDAALLTPGAGMAAEAITTRHGHVGQKGDLTVELHYGDFDTGHGRQAALYVYSRNRQADGAFIPLSMMWQFAEREALHMMIPPMAERVFGFVTKQDQFRLLDAILDYLDDLRKSPPDPNLFKDRSLKAFLQSCADEGLDFEVRMGGRHGKRMLSTH
jgi:hypothetical protein